MNTLNTAFIFRLTQFGIAATWSDEDWITKRLSTTITAKKSTGQKLWKPNAKSVKPTREGSFHPAAKTAFMIAVPNTITAYIPNTASTGTPLIPAPTSYLKVNPLFIFIKI